MDQSNYFLSLSLETSLFYEQAHTSRVGEVQYVLT